jgi:hypothetical protein
VSRKEAILLVSRALALYLLCWTFSELTYVPSSLFSLTHHMSQHSVLVTGDYFTDLDVLSLALRVFRIVTLFGIAAWLYFCGPSAQAYFWPASKTDSGGANVNGSDTRPAAG